MQKVSAQEYKDAVKKLLAYIDEICQEHDIKYFVNYGTLLGAVRHDGFIPWDDDVDISMTKDEYEKFKQYFPAENGRYYILSSETSETYYNNFPRVCDGTYKLKLKGINNIQNLGVYVDVFILYGVPENIKERNQFYREIQSYRDSIPYVLPLHCYRTLSLKGKLSILLKRGIGKNRGNLKELKNKRDDLLTKYDSQESKYVANLFDEIVKFSDKLLLERSQFQFLVRHKFEDIEVNIPSEYDAILSNRYGDYMRLPPIEQQVTTHHFTPYKR